MLIVVLTPLGLKQDKISQKVFVRFYGLFGPRSALIKKMSSFYNPNDDSCLPIWDPFPGVTKDPDTRADKLKNLFSTMARMIYSEEAIENGERCAEWFVEPHRKRPGVFSIMYRSRSHLGFAEYQIINSISGVFVKYSSSRRVYSNFTHAMLHDRLLHKLCKFYETKVFKCQLDYPTELTKQFVAEVCVISIRGDGKTDAAINHYDGIAGQNILGTPKRI